MIEGIYSRIQSWEKKKNLENIKEVVVGFERRINTEVRKQKKLGMAEKRDFRRGELPEKRYCIDGVIGSLRTSI